MTERHVVVGAGPAGLTAAWRLARLGRPVLVLEADPTHVGGLARTMQHRGQRYDVGPHRFYTKSDEIARTWEEMLPGGFREVRRLTRIYFDRSFFPYPLQPWPTLVGMGPLRAGRALLSWARARAFPRADERSFEDWVVNRFGRELYATFFKTYTEKVWGVPCNSINKDWAAQRIRDLSLGTVLRDALWRGRRRPQVKTLIESFHYPPRGAGQLWEAVRDEVRARGGTVELGADVRRLVRSGERLTAATTADGRTFEGDHFHLTLTLKSLVEALDPPPPPEVLAAGRGLRHRDFITAALVVPRAGLFPDQWIYVHDPGVRVARITNYANWSEEMSDDPRVTVLGLEYFCDQGDAVWQLPDAELLALAARELHATGLADVRAAPEGRVHRFVDAYPVYDDGYRERRALLRDWIGRHLVNAAPAGRKGLHNYNSQDHAMMTGLLGVRNLVEGGAFDVWSVNTEEEYAEVGRQRQDIEERLVPRAVDAAR